MGKVVVDSIVVDGTFASPETTEAVKDWFRCNPIGDARLAFTVRIPSADEQARLARGHELMEGK